LQIFSLGQDGSPTLVEVGAISSQGDENGRKAIQVEITGPHHQKKIQKKWTQYFCRGEWLGGSIGKEVGVIFVDGLLGICA
jgi:hypothetical protein